MTGEIESSLQVTKVKDRPYKKLWGHQIDESSRKKKYSKVN